MKFTVQNAIRSKEVSTRDGSKLAVYLLSLTDEAGATKAAELVRGAQRPAPVAGEVLDGAIETTKWGDKLTEARTGGAKGGYSRSAAIEPGHRREQARAEALKQAIKLMVAKASYKKPAEIEKYLTGKRAIQTATYFAGYILGRITVVMTTAEISEMLEEMKQEASADAETHAFKGEEEKEEEKPAEDSAPVTTPAGDIINLDDIVF
jgi:hypothetical protein